MEVRQVEEQKKQEIINDFKAPKEGETVNTRDEANRYVVHLMHEQEKSPEMVRAITGLLEVLLAY